MAYTDDAVLAKLSALNESHDSIATAAQWIMFHRRHADRTVQLWLQRLKEVPSPKRLNLIYLANEVTQQSKARHKDDFVVAFSPVIADATATAYKGATSDLQGKLRRVIDVWRDRSIFEAPIQAAVESRLDELDKARGTQKTGLGGSIFGGGHSASSVPQELAALVAAHQSVAKLTLPGKAAVSSANSDYDKLMDPGNDTSSAPVYAARLNGLLKTLANAEGAVANCVQARKELISALEKLLTANKASLKAEESELRDVAARKTTIDSKKQEVEVAIMRGLAASDQEQSPGNGSSASPPPEPDRPEVEALTPPHIQDEPSSLHDDGTTIHDNLPNSPSIPTAASPSLETVRHHQPVYRNPSAPGIEMLSNIASQYQAVPVAVNGGNKRRRVDSGDDFPDLRGDDGIDADVAEMLRRDSRG